MSEIIITSSKLTRPVITGELEAIRRDLVALLEKEGLELTGVMGGEVTRSCFSSPDDIRVEVLEKPVVDDENCKFSRYVTTVMGPDEAVKRLQGLLVDFYERNDCYNVNSRER